jgi:hypothetical protein
MGVYLMPCVISHVVILSSDQAADHHKDAGVFRKLMDLVAR